MSVAYLNPFDNVDFGAYGKGAQCFDGVSFVDRVTVTTSTAFPAIGSPQMTVPDGVFYLAIFLVVPSLVYAGPPVAAAVRDARAQALPAGWWPMSVQAGHLVFVRDL